MNPSTTSVKKVLRQVPAQFRLVVALVIAISFALGLTVVSVMIYSLAGYNKLDLSRPGYERERKEVQHASESQKVYDTTGPVTNGAVDDFLLEYDNRAKELGKYGDFRDQALSDEDLQLTGQVSAPE